MDWLKVCGNCSFVLGVASEWKQDACEQWMHREEGRRLRLVSLDAIRVDSVIDACVEERLCCWQKEIAV